MSRPKSIRSRFPEKINEKILTLKNANDLLKERKWVINALYNQIFPTVVAVIILIVP